MSKIRVLLVDDEEDYVKTLAERMEMRDVGSRVALSGEEALQMVEDDVPDVMVLDLRMPGIDGMEVLERVKQQHPHVQVIVLTAHGSLREEREARRLGAFEYFQKPADTKILLSTIRKAWKATLAFLRDSRSEFDRSVTAAAFAEAGVPDMAREMMQRPKPRRDDTSSETLKVLLVDDEEDFVTTVADRMEMRELGSDVALSGEQALQMFEADIPDVVVLDLRLPGIDGMEVLQRIKKTHPEVEVIIMAGHGSDQDEERARTLGAFDYLHKPIDINHLVEVVKNAGRARRKAK